MIQLVCLLEEPSARDLLEGLLPKLLPSDWTFKMITFEGKQDLEKRMERFLKTWQGPGAKFVVLRDQDAGDCRKIKSVLHQRCVAAGRPDALVRVACRELESWILGDLEALAIEFECAPARANRNKKKYRDPDALSHPTTELRRLLPAYQKRDGARRMGHHLRPETNSSRSFRAFCDGVKQLINQH